MDKIKLVVFNEHTLGYILPELLGYVQILHASVLRGATSGLHASNIFINPKDNIRLATKEDFASFNHSFEGYESDPNYEYAKS